jgi:signal transduction histidine kinase
VSENGSVLLEGAAGDRLLARVMASQEPVWIERLSLLDAPQDDGMHETTRDGTAVFVPVRFAGELVAVLEVGARRPLQRDDTLVEVLSQVGLQLARAYESELAQKEVREAQLRALESQKLEAVGRLAGGIAHDFNNLLMVVLGEAELALRDGAITPALRSSLEEIRASGQRAALLTARLLAFSRRDMVRAEKIDMCGVLRDAESVLQRVMGEDVHVSTRVDVAPGDCIVEGNRGLLEQVLMNLVVNAREAMPDGGEVEIRLGVTSLSTSTAAAAGNSGANQGRYVFARRFAAEKQRGWAAVSALIGIAFFVSFAALASGSSSSTTMLAFYTAVTLVWGWHSATHLKLLLEARFAHA